MEVLVLTNSFDGSSDIIVKILKKKNLSFLRWNVDLWYNYEIYFDQNNFSVTDNLKNTVSSKNNLKILWRKPFIDLMDFKSFKEHKDEDIKYAKSEMRSVIRSMMAYTRDKTKHFIDPIDGEKLPKLKQLNIAKNYFEILPYEFSVLKNKINFEKSITKALNNPEVGDKTMFTSEINQKELYRPYPWFVQEALTKGRDVTCVFINGEVFFYFCEYKRGDQSLDWRIEINIWLIN